MSRRNKKPPHIGFEGKEGDSGLQESDCAPGWSGGAVDILLRRGIRLFGIPQHALRAPYAGVRPIPPPSMPVRAAASGRQARYREAACPMPAGFQLRIGYACKISLYCQGRLEL